MAKAEMNVVKGLESGPMFWMSQCIIHSCKCTTQQKSWEKKNEMVTKSFYKRLKRKL